MSSTHRSSRYWLYIIFVLSGFAGLIYQSIWSQYLGLFLGHAAYAQAFVLTIFMGGMAAGAAWISNVGERWRDLLRWYALVEAAIGFFGLVFHWFFTTASTVSFEWIIPSLSQPWAINVTRWLVAAILILPQTILLGMTFPLMSGGLIRRFPTYQGRMLGGLYFTNSIGAAAGALVSTFVLIPRVGLPGAVFAAGVLNFVVAGIAWQLAKSSEPQIFKNDEQNRSKELPLLRVVLTATALSGAASFAYEIVWIRMLSMAVGSTMHAFELMLAAFIAGIAFGGLWIRRRADSATAPLQLVGWLQVAMGIAALASLLVYANSFAWVGWLMQSLAKTDGGYALFNFGTASIAIAIMFPAAFFAGTTLPLFTVALLRAGLGERVIGRVYAWNTLGAIFGVYLAVHLLIPNIGLKLALCVAALADIGVGFYFLRIHAADSRSRRQLVFGGGVAICALIIAVRTPFDPTIVASGVYRHGKPSINSSDEIIYYKDGKTASVALLLSKSGSASISTNGKTDAAVQIGDGAPTADEPTMVLLGGIPLSLHDAPKKVGVIGFGSGMTTHTLLGDHRVEQVDTIEIEPSMVQGAKLFGNRVDRSFNDIRSNIIIEDAKAYLAGQNRKYDVLISEPSNPWISGVGSLFSEEFYKFVPKHINEDGIFVQWIQLYEINDTLLASILNALTPAFEDYAAWFGSQTDLILVAKPKGHITTNDWKRIEKSPELKKDLARIGVAHGDHLAFRKVANAEMIRALAGLSGNTRTNSDYYPILSLDAPKTRFRGDNAESTLSIPLTMRSYLEALHVSGPLPSSTPTLGKTYFPPEAATNIARALVAEITGQTVPQALPVIALRDIGKQCSARWTEYQYRTLVNSISELAERTMDFLPANALVGTWINPTWITCDQIPEDLNRALQILGAQSARDYEKMEELGRKWFTQRPTSQYSRIAFDGIAWTAWSAALISQKRWKDLEEASMDNFENSSFKPEHKIMRTFTHNLATQAIARSTH
ncbi:MAG: fused MFS/spermidine synthase [Acidovorax sp.]|uniref:fused MFS/spermidine synthase n=1 Tax=Acidovorax sp. TaxID=1872122 RepID=UPI0025BF30B5|nr:fused MFS/spermidine synthase [Acidovorax sp.]MCE1191359.1 fused MFS/spermidine synthase [Acidovorax sp.]